MSYNGNNRRNFNNNRNNNNRNFNNRNNNRNNNQQNAKKQEIIAKQKKNLDMIEAVAEYLNNIVAASEVAADNTAPAQKITMKEILDYLVNNKGFAQDDTKAVSQFNYIMMDLANAQKSGFINGNRINIRILYIQERLKTSFKKELHPTIDKIMEDYSNLFLWNEDNKSEDSPIEVVPTDEGAPLAPTAGETISTEEVVEEKVSEEPTTEVVEEVKETVEA